MPAGFFISHVKILDWVVPSHLPLSSLSSLHLVNILLPMSIEKKLLTSIFLLLWTFLKLAFTQLCSVFYFFPTQSAPNSIVILFIFLYSSLHWYFCKYLQTSKQCTAWLVWGWAWHLLIVCDRPIFTVFKSFVYKPIKKELHHCSLTRGIIYFAN